ncbi:hypothetical protein JQ617_07935 [Bradyrhizobium sp. KB893862 SZCCT0404]|uniref:hypothetical protein n=1 Tax=Bradyrhizobium sp. KB893862 SZCCT0404 TaxID=2807672 RepID=UPI001BA474EF|nr:hypothetical protein [Bradyrhizobium sp. KB893862 SZCCT0404]MBR1173880.1 hypothetical protein [Bradyrhizobium sp. KB893862 SZCCT0404]
MSRAATCYFTISYGLQGCYMPDSHFGPFAVTRRKDLVNAMRDALEFYEAPKSRLREVSWSKLWSTAKRHGTSSVHFCIATDDHNMVEFHGLTEAEFNEHNKED